jgi:hypothetical protein
MYEALLFFDDKLNNVMDMNSISNCKSILIDADVKHPYITSYNTTPYSKYTNHDAFFNTETGEYTNKYAEYVGDTKYKRGEQNMPTKSIMGDGKIYLVNKEGVQIGGGVKNNMDIINSFIQDTTTPNNLKVIIFDWDRTITSVEGWWPDFFEDIYMMKNSHDSASSNLYNSAIKDTSQYLFGGPEREAELRKMFSNLHMNDISVIILTNNPTASTILFEEEPEVDARQVFLDMVKVVYPEFISDQLISTYQGKYYNILPKSIAYKKFIEANKRKQNNKNKIIGGKCKRNRIIQTKRRVRRNRRKNTTIKHKINKSTNKRTIRCDS